MSDADTAPEDVDEAVAALYAGAPESFVAGRDRLVRSLRAGGRRDEATVVAKLRRPSRLAWPFDAAVAAAPGMVSRVNEAVTAVGAAQQGQGDLRGANAALRAVTGELVDAAHRAGEEAGRAVERSRLLPAALAVVGDPEALAALGAGRLAEVPTGGGFGPLAEPVAESTAAVPTAPDTSAGEAAAPTPGAPRRREGAAAAERAGDDEVTAARRAARDAATRVSAATRDRDAAEAEVAAATRDVEETEERRRAAERAATEAARRRQEAEEALATVRDRLRAVEDADGAARARLAELGG